MKNKGFLKAIFRGAIKSIPGGNVITEILGNIKVGKDNADPNTKSVPLPHNYYSIAMQVIGTGAIIYAFATKMITLNDLLKLCGMGE